MVILRTKKFCCSYSEHRAKWIGCQECGLCQRRLKVVLARGQVPCQVLFVGEAPGDSENVLGVPFVGPAGKLLDQIMVEAGLIEHKGMSSGLRYALTNLVCCIPKGEDGKKAGEPPEESIKACAPRLREFVALCKPNLLVTVGKLSKKWLQPILECNTSDYQWLDILHPAAILRLDVSQKGLAIQRCVVSLRDAIESLS